MTILELTDKYGETNTNPYVDTTANNEDENLTTNQLNVAKTLLPGMVGYCPNLTQTKDNIQTVGNHR